MTFGPRPSSPVNRTLSSHEGVEVGIRNFDPCLIFLCGDAAPVPHQVGFQRITPSALATSGPSRRSPEKVINFHGHIVSMAIHSGERELLYVNVRAWPDGAQPTRLNAPPISNQIVVHVIDLRTLEVIPEQVK